MVEVVGTGRTLCSGSGSGDIVIAIFICVDEHTLSSGCGINSV